MQMKLIRTLGFNPFFIRAFASTHRAYKKRWLVPFQSLLHQGIREHGSHEEDSPWFCFNPFFIRAFASTHFLLSEDGNKFQSLLHQGIREHQQYKE